MFLGLALAARFSRGSNLPLPMDVDGGLWLRPYEAWTAYAFYLILLVTLFTASLIQWDREPVPFRLFLPALVLGFTAPLFLHHLHRVGLSPHVKSDAWLYALANASTGLTVGGLFGLLVWPATRLDSSRTWPTIVVCGGVCGLFLGWQAAAALTAVAALLYLLFRAVTRVTTRTIRRQIPWTLIQVVCVFLFLLTWKGLVTRWPELGRNATLTHAAVAAGVVLASSVATGWLSRFRSPSDQSPQLGDTMGPNDAQDNLQAIIRSPSYKLAELDTDLLQRPEMRPIRLQLELLKPEMAFKAQQVHSTIVVFGGTHVVESDEAERRLAIAKQSLAADPDDEQLQRQVARAERIAAKSSYYEAAREFARLVSSMCQENGSRNYVITTGGGPGIMEAANRGAFEVGAKSVGLNITLPAEQAPNPYITPELCFQFHYFALRKLHFLLRAKALIIFPGGFGTLDELFETLTLRQTNRMQEIPVILYGREYWENAIDFHFLADEGVVADEDLRLIQFAETPQQAWDIIATFHSHE